VELSVTPVVTSNRRKRERQANIADEEGAEDSSVFHFLNSKYFLIVLQAMVFLYKTHRPGSMAPLVILYYIDALNCKVADSAFVIS
jgi:hypothetical protein